ncbi:MULTISPECIES: GIY-YIG nuclease family protein [Photobacterium]|uniref:Chromosome partitioning protein ParA n=1 Tax=Photobacterium aquimaris TaxID=512643 RepID=A0A2T3I0F9_9GAMM|nr:MULTISPECIES: GIY-YIG nuclease family protein [Photobacterium]MCD9553488.1 GIY-YIG nuclease family protein [Photobacterium carnosum]OBU25566.1 hypothetical protein AYY21_08270 [Photobacterium aquimaris]PQJ37135.1 hypothetical protein BTN98_18515 [Photobacterium aquimaris]PSU10009.1 chromosome partitioning protein ParA [Photobacterium aquimaris]
MKLIKAIILILITGMLTLVLIGDPIADRISDTGFIGLIFSGICALYSLVKTDQAKELEPIEDNNQDKINELVREKNKLEAYQEELDKFEIKLNRFELQLDSREQKLARKEEKLANTKINSEEYKLAVSREVSKKVNNELRYERAELAKDKVKATKILQKLLDQCYQDKVKAILNGLTLKNQNTRYDMLDKNFDKYTTNVYNFGSFDLECNDNWGEVAEQFDAKIELLEMAQIERDHQADIKRQMREEKQREEELEAALEAEELEQARIEEQQRILNEALATANAEAKVELEKQREELEAELAEVHKRYERTKSMAEQTKQGYVYVISNIGSLGEKVYKVGMTRRLDPLDRVKELSNASVPFEFDVHAMINCEDAPKLEKALHRELDQYRVNKINNRKEFFKVDLDTIIKSVENNHGEVEYCVNPVAFQYYKTLELENQLEAA